MSEKTILITGATGFVGAYILHYLVQQGCRRIRALKRPDSPMDLVSSIADRVEWVEGDLLDLPSLEDAMEGVQQVYHSAAVVSFQPGERQRIMRVNQQGTENIVNLSLDFGIEKLVHISSIAAIGRKKNETIISEDTKWEQSRSNNPYGISKYLAEMEVWRGMAEGLPAAIVNPSNVMGSGFWEGRTTSGQLFHKIWKGFPFYAPGGTGFVDVRDVARFSVQLMNSPIQGERFILNAENLPYKEVFFDIADNLQVKRPYIEVTPLIRETAWRVSWLISKLTGKRPFITKQTARYAARQYFYENRKSLEAFPFQYTPIRQTILETSQQFLAQATQGYRPAVLPFP